MTEISEKGESDITFLPDFVGFILSGTYTVYTLHTTINAKRQPIN
jgi:hypothetical protein